MVSLELCDMSSNHLTGTIPEAMSELAYLEKLVLAGNLLSGHLSLVVNASLQVGVTVLDLSNNILSGSLPDGIFQLPSIETIALSGERASVLCGGM